MSRPIEAVAAEAQKRLETSGRLDIAAIVAAYPEHAQELKEILPVMLLLHQEKRWQEAEARSRAHAVGLFSQLAQAPATTTVGNLFERERAEAGLSLEEQARRSGLPASALQALRRENTPVSNLDNATIKQIAARVAAPFAALVKEVRRLASLESLTNMQAGPVFTRDRETSTADEQEALRQKVRQYTRKRPEGQKHDPPSE